jgi:hypothetical protein
MEEQIPTDEIQPSSGEDLAPEQTSDEQNQEETQTTEEESPKRDRSAEAIIPQLTAEKRELERKLEEQPQQSVPQSNEATLSPDEIQAKNLLTGKLGIADQDSIQREIRALESRLTMDSKHARMENVYDGSDGRPKYDRVEIEDFMRTRGDIFDPETAYEKLYRDELLDWEIKKATSNQKPKAYEEAPTAPAKRESGAITAEKVAEMQAKGRDVFLSWYTKNREAIKALAAEGKL